MGTKNKKMKTEKTSASDFLIWVFILSHVFDDIKDNYKIKSLCMLPFRIKYKSITGYTKNKKRISTYIIIPKGTFHFKYASKE